MRDRRGRLLRWALGVAFALGGCAHASAMRYTFTPCDAGFQQAVQACFYEGHMGPIPAAYDFYADSGTIERQWKRQYESCMFRRGYNQLGEPFMWIPKEQLNGREGWLWPNTPPRSAWTWVRTAGSGDRHYYDAVCEP